MPPRWPRKPDRNDPEYRRLDDRMNFAIHVGLFSATNSGLWFVHNLQKADWPWATSVTGGWALVVLATRFTILRSPIIRPSPKILAEGSGGRFVKSFD